MLGTNHILENSQKLSPRVVQPPGASMLTHGWVRTVRTAQNLHCRHSVGRTASRSTSWTPNCAFGPIESKLWPRSIYKDHAMAHARQYCRGHSMTSLLPIGDSECAIDAAAERALLFAPAVRRRSVGPHAVPRSGNRSRRGRSQSRRGEGSPFTLYRAGVALPSPKS